MLDQLYTASRINEEIARRDGLDPEGKANLVLKTKLLVARGYLTHEHDPNAKPTSPKFYDIVQLIRAAVLTDALVTTFETDGLRTLSDALSKQPITDYGHPPSADANGAFIYEGGGLKAAMRGVKANDDGQWRLDYSCGREHGKRPIWISHVIYLPVGEPEPISYLSVLRRPILRGTFDLTARIGQFADLLA